MAQTTKWKPEGMHSVISELIIEGCSDAIESYKKVFGAVEKSKMPDPSGKKIWHADICIGDSHIFMADASAEMGNPKGGGERLWLYLEDADQTMERAKAAGFKVLMPMADMFWGDRMGKVADRWGNEWTIAKRVKDLTPEEMKKAGEAFAASQKK